MSHISTRLLLKTIDQITGVVKAQVSTPAPSEDLYTIVIKEQNPDDLVDGVSPALATDAKVAGGLGMYSQWTSEITWLNKRAVAAGSTDLAALAAARFSRIPNSFDAYVWSPSRNLQHMAAATLFADDSVTFGTAIRGGSETAYTDSGNALPATVAHALFEVDNTLYGGSAWTLNFVGHHANGATSAIAVVSSATGTSPVGHYVGSSGLVATAGSSSIGTTSITGIASGHRMLIVDKTYPSLITTAYFTGGTEVWIDPKYIGYFDPADEVEFYHFGASPESDTTSEINNIEYETGKITLNAALAICLFPDDAPMMKLKTARGDGWQEAHYVATAAAGVVTFSGPLYHSFYGSTTDIYPLLTDVVFASGSGGTVTDTAIVKTKSERTIS